VAEAPRRVGIGVDGVLVADGAGEAADVLAPTS
jgi:hypothetical protein